ncbi:sulfotransferase domain-containing protein [Pelagicoccus sp. SDUM812003]|uniref:sulfotransferase domain-containing protein n=1 Tax=Pelagicoccus sp. SDUM812003 TaxID=3041267 RepID=UPI00280F74C3|nr:sulfotransferase domain-containing protein [Pelagicoccus sp. SDUM812003]MDQ8203596.1 sulfotransferase domain-containing protein [Pelagicoccus sp. SDUM812003]
MNFRKNVVLKKAWRYGAAVPRAFSSATARPSAWRQNPPVLANSFPKSGTHLLQQILSVLPGMKDWGGFWASQPSFTFREIQPEAMSRRIRRVSPGELVCGHLYYSDQAKEALESRHVAHFFIYRDPRDVVVSEAHYLGEMNRWHKLHSRFSKLPTRAERLLLSIKGLPKEDIYYPNIVERFSRFTQWIEDPNVCSISYEDLISENKYQTIEKIIKFYCSRSGYDYPVEALIQRACEAIQPSKSHTFRRGGSGGWKSEFDGGVKELFKQIGGAELVMKLGYEKSVEW